MPPKQDKYGSTRGIIGKVLVAMILAVGVLAGAIYLTRSTFFDVNERIQTLSRKQPKIDELNRFYSDFEKFERDQQVDFLSGTGSDSTYFAELNGLLFRLDSMKNHFEFSEIDKAYLDTISHHIDTQGQRLMAYRQLRSREQPLLDADLENVIELITSSTLQIDSSVVTTERTLRRLRTRHREEETEQEKKSFFQRLFSGKASDPPPQEEITPAVVEETNITIDTLAVQKLDTAAIAAGEIIRNIKREQVYVTAMLREMELDMLRGSSYIQNRVQTLIRRVEGEELQEIQRVSAEAASLMDQAMNDMFLIWGLFAILAMFLVYTIADDLARSRYYRKQLVEAKERAENLSRTKEQFLANMSHELRTPLQSILGYSEQLIEDPDHSEEISVIHRSSEHLLHIVNEILDFSRIDKGHLTLYPQNFDLVEEVETVVRNIEIQARHKGLRLLYSKTLDNVTVYADPFRLRQILFNILGNAVKFTEKGFVQLRLNLEDKGDHYIFGFEVEDTGIGMESEELTQIFNEFARGKGAKYAVTGTGLGLSIVKTLTEAFNGTIEVESKKNHGTTFKGTLRLDHPRKMEKNAHQDELREPVKSILLVDDDQSILNLTQRILSKRGIEVRSTTSPLKAVNILRSGEKFDLALVDFRMPEMNGEELREEIKKLLPDLPVIAMTANVHNTHGDYSDLRKFDGVLHKPFRASELLKLLGHADEKDKSKTSETDDFHHNMNKVTLGDEELAKEITAQFKEDCEGDIKTIQRAMETRDTSLLREAAHRLAGRMGQFHVGHLERFYRRTENLMAQSEKWADGIQQEQEEGIERLREFLTTI